MTVKQVRFFFAVLLIQCIVAWIVCANPSHKLLDAPLAAHGKGAIVPWHKEASGLYETTRNKLLSYLEKEQKNAVKAISAEDLGKTHLMTTLITREGNKLQYWGEPSGVDFMLRGNVMQGQVKRVIELSKQFPATQKYMENFREFITKSTQSRAKALANIEKLCNGQKWPEAEVALLKVFDTLEPGCCFLSSPENSDIYTPFAQVRAAIERAMREIRSASAAEELTKTIGELTPAFANLQQEIQAAVESIAATGTATWRGEMVRGPQLVEKIAQAWRETQVLAHQCRGKQWAFAFRTNYVSSSAPAMDPSQTQVNDTVSTPYAAFSGEVMKSLARLVEVDATRATVDVARNLYVEYLRALAPLVRQSNQREWGAQLELALSKFQGKVPELDLELKNYAAATNDLLRWRARAAAAQAATLSAEYAAIEGPFHAAILSGAVNGGKYIGLIPEPPNPATMPQLLTDAPDSMPVAVQRLIGKKATVRDVVRISPESKSAIARYSRRTYAMLPMPLDLAAQVDALEVDLMVSEAAPPMSLAAMQAITTAERGDLIAAGGEISGATLEGVITRFASLPVGAVVLTELGRLPPEPFDGGKLQNMMMRFDITPHWACHDYFFVKLAPPSNLTAAR